MKVLLISTDESRSILGIRTLSSCLAEKEFEPILVMMSTPGDHFPKFRWEDLEALCRDACLIGISCMTHGVGKAVEVKRRIQEWTSSPIVIGGIHATMVPESLTGEFDMICYGEGEDLFVDLAQRIRNGDSFSDIPGLWLRDGSEWIRNPSQALQEDLNDYPFPDYDLNHQYVLEGDRIVPMTRRHIDRDFFVIMGSRGCPHHCTYCCNRTIKAKFPWRKHVRHYTIDNLIRHLRMVSTTFEHVRSFWIDDDTFFAKSRSEIEKFSDRYGIEIGKPFLVLISPWTFNDEKLQLLIACGLCRLIMGIQTGSDNTSKNIYDRNLSSDKIMKIAHSLHKYSDKILVSYDFIGMNPFESEDDLVDTIRFIRSLPPPFFIFNNNLAFYPGTTLHASAADLGIDVSDRTKHTDAKIGYKILIREKIQNKIFHLLLLMMQHNTRGWHVGGVPRFMLSDGWIAFYRFLNRRLKPISDGLTTGVAWGFHYLN
jgi:radical SAM superfamily enzyme YgiQ (UPF0313 family)